MSGSCYWLINLWTYIFRFCSQAGQLLHWWCCLFCKRYSKAQISNREDRTVLFFLSLCEDYIFQAGHFYREEQVTKEESLTKSSVNLNSSFREGESCFSWQTFASSQLILNQEQQDEQRLSWKGSFLGVLTVLRQNSIQWCLLPIPPFYFFMSTWARVLNEDFAHDKQVPYHLATSYSHMVV